jgi:hypothetical protein
MPELDWWEWLFIGIFVLAILSGVGEFLQFCLKWLDDFVHPDKKFKLMQERARVHREKIQGAALEAFSEANKVKLLSDKIALFQKEIDDFKPTDDELKERNVKQKLDEARQKTAEAVRLLELYTEIHDVRDQNRAAGEYGVMESAYDEVIALKKEVKEKFRQLRFDLDFLAGDRRFPGLKRRRGLAG